jgi:ketosteroid isomerase-like protein
MVTLESSGATFSEAVARGDAVAVAALYAHDASLVQPGVPVIYRRKEIRRFWLGEIERGVTRVKLQPLKFKATDQAAHEFGRYWVWIEPGPDGWRCDRGTYILVHNRRLDGSWLWVVHVFAPDTPTRTS